LGVHERPARKRPFAAGRVRSAKVAAEPEITFVVPFAGRGDDLAETVRSLQTQPSGRFLALVLIANSAPIPFEVPAKDTRVRVEVAPPGVDPDAHLRAVLSAVATPFVAVLNAGDVLHQERVAQCLAEFAADPRLQVVATGRALLDQDGLEITAANASRLLDGDEAVALVQARSGAAPEVEGPFSDVVSWLSKDRLGTLGSCVFRREVFAGSVAATTLRSAGAGWELALPVAAAGAFRLLDTVSIASRIAVDAPSSQPERKAAVARIAAQFDGEVARWLGTSVAAGDDTATADQPATEPATSATIEALREALIERDVLCVEAHATAAARALADADKARLARKIQELERSIAGMAQKVARVDDLERRQGTMLSDRSDQETRIGKLREDKTLLRADIDEVRRDRESLRTDLAALRTDLAAVHQDQEGMRATLQALREERAVLDSTISRLYSDLANLERVRKETEERRAAMTVLRDEQQELVRVRSEQLAHEHAQLEQRTRELAERTADRDGQSAQRAALEAELATTRARVEAADSKLEAAAVQLADTEVSLQTTTAQRDALQSELDQRASELQARTFERDVLATAHTRMLSHNQALQDQNKKLAERAALLDLSLADTKAALAHESKRLADLEVERLRLHSVRESLQRGMASLRQELDRVRQTREFRVGNLLWNKLPLGYVSRRLKKWLRRLRDARTRFALRFSSPRAAAGGESLGRAVVAATRQWPIYSHTFVYQEMTSLREAGLDVTLFHWDHGKKSHLHDAFRALGDRSVQLQPIVEIHRRDKRYFERTRPGRLRAFLERVAAATGRTVESLEEEPLVLQGCTFARMAELAKVRYFHSYFFYDQSFLTMQAAFLLDVPRGISCYADHMLDDYPWKLVPLHLELASVVVATSQRIRKELSEKGGGRFDDKILVKPNGVDGARWPVIERSPRTGAGRFAVVSLSRIEPKKGLVHLVEAVAILRGKGLDVVAHVIGAVDPEIPASLVAGEELERRIAEKGLRDHVILHGMKLQEQIRPILAEARAFVAPYVELPTGDKDGIPTAMLEAMSTGLPVVATDASSIREVLDDGVQGFLVKQGDSKALAAAIERLVLEPETEQRMAKAARARFAERFDVRKTEPILHERVRALLAASRPGGAVPIGPARGEGKDGRPERKDGAASGKSSDGRTRAAR
ncbi:MAG: glycosyltransferase, partial [Planctomycetota bacterium]